MRALFLITPAPDPHNDNHLRLPASYAAAGWQVDTLAHESLLCRDDQVYAGTHPLSDYDLIWPVGFGPARTWLDRCQLLALIPQRLLICPVWTQARLHSKTAWLAYAPLSLVSNDSDEILQFMNRHAGQWVLKPTVGSYGRSVHRVEQASEVVEIIDNKPGYWLLQRFLPEIRDGEIRTLIAGGEVLGSYRRLPEAGEFRANLSQGAGTQTATLTAAEAERVNDVLEDLVAHRVGFAAIDQCAGYVIEVNVVNPGGLGTLADLTGKDLGHELVGHVTRWLTQRAE